MNIKKSVVDQTEISILSLVADTRQTEMEIIQILLAMELKMDWMDIQMEMFDIILNTKGTQTIILVLIQIILKLFWKSNKANWKTWKKKRTYKVIYKYIWKNI